MTEKLVRIVPPQGDGLMTGMGTRVFTADGEEIEHVTKVTVTFSPDEFVTATIECAASAKEMMGHPLLGLCSLERAAAAYGFDLVKRDPPKKLPRICGCAEESARLANKVEGQ